MDTNHADVAQAEVMAILDERVEACRAKDINRLMPLYSPDIVYFDIIPPHRFIGADDVRRNFLRWFDEYQGDIGLETHDLRVAVSGDVAFAHTVCLQRIDDHWLITHEHISFPINPESWSAVVDGTP
jgi:ketosteroid isomerase-like protein